MFKIAILGCENSHANAFLQLIKDGKYPDIEVVGVYSDEKEPPQKLQEEFGVSIMNTYDELVGKVDGIMVTARHGANHYKYAKPYMPSGIPMFIDKPITIDIAEAEQFMAEAKQYGVRFCGGSTCGYLPETQELKKLVSSGKVGEVVGGNVVAPLWINEQYGGFYFYAQHLVQIMTEIFGYGAKRVFTNLHDTRYALIFDYGTFDVTANYAQQGNYAATVVGAESIETRAYNVGADAFAHEMDEMQKLLKGEAQAFTYEEFIQPVRIMNAIDRSTKSNTWEEIE